MKTAADFTEAEKIKGFDYLWDKRQRTQDFLNSLGQEWEQKLNTVETVPVYDVLHVIDKIRGFIFIEK